MRRRNAKTTGWQRRAASACFGLGWLLALGPSAVIADTLAVPHTFTNGTVADADQVNANFDAVKVEVDDNDLRIDTLFDQSCPAGEVVIGVDASGSIVCTPAPPPVDPTCPAGTNLRTPTQVIQDLRVAIAAQDAVAIGCNYVIDAHTINDQGICIGRTDIASAAISKSNAFGGASPTITSETISDNLVRVLYTLAGGGLSIADGVETYLIENGQIRRATDHGFIGLGPP